jgi:cytochrome-b5 reductase
VAKTFTGGDQGFIDLKLAEVVPYNHNTKVLKFELPDPEHVSGLTVACKFIWLWRHAYEEKQKD